MEKKKSHGKTIVIILLLLIILGLIGYILIEKDIIKLDFIKKMENTEKVEKIEKENKDQLDKDNYQVLNLFKEAHAMNNGIDENVYSVDSVKVSKMDDAYKMKFAYNNLDKSIITRNDDDESIIKEDDIKNSFELIFGPNTYKHVSLFDGDCKTFKYDAASKSYIDTTGSCTKTSMFNINEEILEVYKYTDKIEITSSVIFVDNEDKEFYKDYNKEEKIDNIEYDSFDSEAYITSNFDKLENYKYIYKLNKDGFYYLDSIEKVN